MWLWFWLVVLGMGGSYGAYHWNLNRLRYSLELDIATGIAGWVSIVAGAIWLWVALVKACLWLFAVLA